MKPQYGEETKKALKNFPFDYPPFPVEFIVAIALIKKAAAAANMDAGHLDRARGNAIRKACDEIIGGKFDGQFPLPSLMGGAGTSIHMNVNEVIANRATEILKKKGKKILVHPNDHVNRSQSTNDVNPSAIKIAAALLIREMGATLDLLAAAFDKKAREFKNVRKLGRTHLMDAVPITLGSEFAAYAALIREHKKEVPRLFKFATTLHLGGTAAGNSVNASSSYRKAVYRHLKKITGLPVRMAGNLMARAGSQTDVLKISQALVALTLDASKIATDLRLMGSGPKGGFGEIALEEIQKGSSIMPGKVNPVLPETVNVLYYLVSGNNLTIEKAAEGANLELAVMIPPVADRLLESLKAVNDVLGVFTIRCVASITANEDRCRELLELSTAYATMLTPTLGYETVSSIVKESVKTGHTIRDVVVAKKLLTVKEFDRIVRSPRS